MKTSLLVVLVPILVIGCATDPSEAHLREPHVDGRIKSVQYEPGKRTPTTNIGVLHKAPDRPHDAIAYFTAEAPPPEETKIIEGMLAKTLSPAGRSFLCVAPQRSARRAAHRFLIFIKPLFHCPQS